MRIAIPGGKTVWRRVTVGYRYYIDGVETDIGGHPLRERDADLDFPILKLIIAIALLIAFVLILPGCTTPGQLRAQAAARAQENADLFAYQKARDIAGPAVPVYEPPVIERFGEPTDLTTYGRPGHSGMVQVAKCQVDVGQDYPGGPARAKAIRRCYDLLPPGNRQRLYETDREIIISEPDRVRLDIYLHHGTRP